MKIIARAALLAAFLLTATGCAGGVAKLDLSDRAADRIVEDVTSEQRAIRAAALAAVAIEIATDRIYREDPGDAAAAWLFIAQLEFAIGQIRAASGMWSNADMFDAKRIVILAAGERAKDRAKGLLASLGLGDALKSVARGAKAIAMLRDVTAIIEDIQAEKLTVDEAWAGIEARNERNKARLRPLVAPGFAPAPQDSFK